MRLLLSFPTNFYATPSAGRESTDNSLLCIPNIRNWINAYNLRPHFGICGRFLQNALESRRYLLFIACFSHASECKHGTFAVFAFADVILGGIMSAKSDSKSDVVVKLPIGSLKDFSGHPYKVRDDESMRETAESVKTFGVLVPIIVRPCDGGGYEIISGHRRKRACELAGIDAMPAIVRDLDDDAATIVMVDSNLQRENVLPSERAQAYKMKLEAMKRQAGRPSKENVSQVGTQKRSDQIMAEELGESRNQIQRYIRLTELAPELQEMVDNKKIAFTPAVELSYLSESEQQLLLDAMDSEQATPSLSQAQRLKQFSQRGELTAEVMRAILSEEKKPEIDRITITGDRLRKYFPRSYTPKQMEETIIKLLEQWQKRRKREAER